DDPRDGIPQFVRAVAAVAPTAFLMENVAGLARSSNARLLQLVLDDLRGLGYTVDHRVLHAADYGVPQARDRLVVVGVRPGIAFQWPDATHGAGRALPHRTAGEVVESEPAGDPNPSIVTYAKAPSLRPDAYHGHLWNGGGRPIDLARPAPTLLASMGGNKTPWVDTLGIVSKYHAHLLGGGSPQSGQVPGARRITATEAAALQSFPAGFVFEGKRSSQYRQIGNSVPPQLARSVAEALAASLG
ncbi:MAG: DNA cytosine methyltransferase, partial [Acidimicrobiales bacterium]